MESPHGAANPLQGPQPPNREGSPEPQSSPPRPSRVDDVAALANSGIPRLELGSSSGSERSSPSPSPRSRIIARRQPPTPEEIEAKKRKRKNLLLHKPDFTKAKVEDSSGLITQVFWGFVS